METKQILKYLNYEIDLSSTFMVFLILTALSSCIPNKSNQTMVKNSSSSGQSSVTNTSSNSTITKGNIPMATDTIIPCPTPATGGSFSKYFTATMPPCSDYFQVSSYDPPAGNVNALPTEVRVTFNEWNFYPSSIDMNSQLKWPVTDIENYSFKCGSESFAITIHPSTIGTEQPGVVAVGLPQPLNLPAGTTCRLTLSGSMIDGYNKSLSSINNSVSYTLPNGSGAAFQIASFDPPQGNFAFASAVNPNPTNITISYNSHNLDLSGGPNSEINPANYSMHCGNLNLNALNVVSKGEGTIQLGFAPLLSEESGVLHGQLNSSLPSGTACTLAVASNVADANGNVISGAISASYTLVPSVADYSYLGFYPANNSQVLVSSFVPAAGNVNSVPTLVSVNFNDPGLNWDWPNPQSMCNPNNFSLRCGGNSYSPTSVRMIAPGKVDIFLPKLDMARGTVCTLNVSQNIYDYYIKVTTPVYTHLSGAVSVSYTVNP